MIAIDFETSWTKDRSIATHGTVGYLRHPETDIFMVSIYDADSGLSYVGDPKDAPWDRLHGQALCAHNWSFDSAVIAECERRGIIPFPLEPKGFCTADLVSYLQMPRALAGAVQVAFGRKLDKSVRDAFKGKDYHTMTVEEKVRIAEYALGDAKDCWLLWKTYQHLWPEHEQALSQHTSMMGQRGICMDAEGVESGARKLKEVLFQTSKQIPWIDEHPATSPIQLKKECLRVGIPAPESTAKNDEGFIKWAATYSSKAPFVGAVAKYRSTNRAFAVLEAMQSRYVDGRLRYGLKYFGANHTGRWSGDSGWNAQNQPRDEVDGVDVRGLLMADPDSHLVIADYAQIEARVLLWLAGDEEQLKLIREGMCVYEAHARKTMGYDDARSLKQAAKDDPAFFKLRQYSKARVLGLGFSLGHVKFQSYAKVVAGVGLTLTEAKQAVDDYRKNNPRIVALWKQCDSILRASASERTDKTATVELPSGRVIRYFNCSKTPEGIVSRKELGGPLRNTYGGLVVENLTQATAREFMSLAILRIEAAGYPVLLHVHDEIVASAPDADLQDHVKRIEALMLEAPAWAAGLPVGVESAVSKRYEK